MTEEILQKLVDFISTASPVLWDVSVKKLYIDVYAQSAFGILALIVFLVLAIKVKKLKKDEFDDHEPELIGCYIFMVITSIIVVYSVFDVVMTISNPTYWIIKGMLDLLND